MAFIWIVEDDDDIRGIVTYAIETMGYKARGFDNADSFFSALDDKTAHPPDVLILDIMLPSVSGLEILKKLRKTREFEQLPIIMLTAKSSEHDKIIGLDLGADDYISKPFGVMELISRIKALMRRSKKENNNEYLYRGIEIRHNSRTVFSNDAVVNLTFKEYELLYYLMLNADMVLSRDQILQTVWGFDFEGESRTLDMHIKALRTKLGENGQYIKTIRNVGYKLGD